MSLSPPTYERARASYEVGIICALAKEKAAVEASLDERHPRLPQAAGDSNNYSFGTIGCHNVVVACLPGDIGTTSATAVAINMMRSFPIKIGLMVGICGGVWNNVTDVRLGDVVVSKPDGSHGGVVQYDFGKMEEKGFRRTGTLSKPPKMLRSAVAGLHARHIQDGNHLTKHLETMLARNPEMSKTYGYPGTANDILFNATYSHGQGHDCAQCDLRHATRRPRRDEETPKVHYGNIASGNMVIRDALMRDRLADEEGVLGFEMEAAGLMDDFPCLVIRGVCDYADTHKNKRWQEYAAATAAAYAKELLLFMGIQELRQSEAAGFSKYHISFSLEGIPATDYFVSRDKDMQHLELYFRSSIPRIRRFVVYGLGGMGKTQLCIEFARRHHRMFTAIFWLDGSSKSALLQSMANASLRIPGLVKASQSSSARHDEEVLNLVDSFRQWLSLPDNHSWLLILDNVELEWQGPSKDPDAYAVEHMLPHVDHGNILISTRISRLRGQPEASLHLDSVDASLAKDMIEGRAARQLPGVDKLIEKLGGMPLALIQAGAYLGGTGMDVGTYSSIYNRTWSTLMEHQNQFPLQEYGERSVLTTWKVSYDQVKSISAQAARLLDLWAFLHPRDVWSELATCFGTETDGFPSLGVSTEVTFWHSVGLLAHYSLVTAAKNNTVSVHPVVHAWCLHNIESGADKQLLYNFALRLVTEGAEKYAKSPSLAGARRLVPHAKAIADTQQILQKDESANDYHSIAYFLEDWEKSELVENLYTIALQGKQRTYGPSDMSTLTTVNSLAHILTARGRLKEAESMYLRALKGREQAYSTNPMPVLSTINGLGILYAAQGNTEKAEAMYSRALEGYEQLCGLEDSRTLNTVNNLGNLYRKCGQLAKAETLFSRALKGHESACGPDHLRTLGTVHNLGLLHMKQNQFAEAEIMLLRALRGHEAILGSDHTSTLDIVNDLGLLYGNMALRSDEAESMHLRTLQGREKLYGTNHPLVFNIVHNIGVLYTDRGDLKAAEEMFLRELDRGPESLLNFSTFGSLGRVYLKQGRKLEAEEMYLKALEGKEKSQKWGPDDPSTINTLDSLGKLYASWPGKETQAEEMFSQSLQRKDKTFGLNHRSTLDTVLILGRLYVDRNKVLEAVLMNSRLQTAYDLLRPSAQARADTFSESLAMLECETGYEHLCHADLKDDTFHTHKSDCPGPFTVGMRSAPFTNDSKWLTTWYNLFLRPPGEERGDGCPSELTDEELD